MFRKEYDGAQDFDLILRTCLSLSMDDNDRDYFGEYVNEVEAKVS